MNIVCITTRNRNELLIEVLKKIPKDYLVLIFQDGDGDYSESKEYLKDYKNVWYKYKNPHGKILFWALWNDMFNILKDYKFDLVHFISDDTTPVDEYFNLIPIIFAFDNKMEVLNTFAVEAHRRMYYKSSALMDFGRYKVFNIEKLDCAFVCRRSFFERLEWKVLPPPDEFNFGNGSGVGYYMTQRYILNGGKTLNILPSLLIHEGVISAIGNNLNFNVVKSILAEKEVKKIEIIDDGINKKAITWDSTYDNKQKVEAVISEPKIYKRVVWSLDSSYAGVSFIANYLNSKVIMYNKRREDFDKMMRFTTFVDDQEETLDYLKNTKELILFGAKGIQYLLNILGTIGKRLKDYKVTALITDNWYYKDRYLNAGKIDEQLSEVKDLRMMFMPDVAHWKPKYIKKLDLYYQYLPTPEIKCRKIGVAHSPGLKLETDEKGTSLIKNVCEELGMPLNIISGKVWNDCLKEKAKAEIFIDQVIDFKKCNELNLRDNYFGGIGKSGLEAMKLGCVVITSGQIVGNAKLPKAPVIIVDNEDELKETLKGLTNIKEIAKKQKAWADKYTGLKYVLNKIDSGLEKCSQIKSSVTLSFFNQRMADAFDLKEYKNKKKATLFFGMYRIEDYETVRDHKGKGVVLFGGSDAEYYRVFKSFKKDLQRFRLVSISGNVQKRLQSYGLETEYIPIIPNQLEMDYQKRDNSECVYFYGRGVKYGSDILPYIKEHIPFKVIEANPGDYSDIKEVYNKCFVGLRLTERDGMSNTVIELGLMGRKVIYNANPIPNAINYKDADDVIRLIKEEYKNRKKDYSDIPKQIYNYIEKTNNWLYL